MLIPLAMSLAGIGSAALPAATGNLDCSEILQVRPQGETRRPIEATDLIETLDIGSNGGMENDSVFSLSRDQSRLAVSVRRADVGANAYCSGVYIVSREGKSSLIDASPGAAFWRYDNFYNTHGFPTGVAKVMTPLWSPDSNHLAFLKLVNGRLQLWLWDEDLHTRVLATSEEDIVDFRFDTDGKSVVYKKRDDGQAKVDFKREALRGFHLDERFFPFASTIPFASGVASYRFYRVQLIDGATRPATESEVKLFEADEATAQDNAGRTAQIRVDSNGASRVHTLIGSREVPCSSDSCTDVVGQPWMTPSGQIRFVRREGWGRSTTAVYDWNGSKDRPVRLFETNDILIGCVPMGDDVVCAREASNRPRFIDRINVRQGVSKSLFEPNPDYQSLVTGRVERLRWTNAFGVQSFGDLIYPPNYEVGRRYPLIITQYGSRGFLRGGTGDEYPIQLFADAGYMVLSIDRPQSPFSTKGLTVLERQKRENENFLGRRSILSSIEIEISHLVMKGLVDPTKVGITGLSDGSTTTQFAALHSDMFAAASISNCCWEPSQTWLLGNAIQQQYERTGWPSSPETGSKVWSEISLSRNANRVAFPILIQAADSELLPALESIRAMRDAKTPIDVFVFQDEQHIKRHPAHRLNIYRRNIRWFDFWLLGKLPRDEEDLEEVSRWSGMKKEWNRAIADRPDPRSANVTR